MDRSMSKMKSAGNFNSAKWVDLHGIGRRFRPSARSKTAIDLVPLQEGSRGAAVKQLQMKLTELNFYQGASSGYFDSATRQALEAFQHQFKLEEIGVFGTETWYALTFWNQET